MSVLPVETKQTIGDSERPYKDGARQSVQVLGVGAHLHQHQKPAHFGACRRFSNAGAVNVKQK